MDFKPLYKTVVIEEIEQNEVHGLIHIPDTIASKTERTRKGKVVAVGKGEMTTKGVLIPPLVKVGDIVIFNQFRSRKMTVKGTEYHIIPDYDIPAIVVD